jgi:signal transduction histidine kinase
VRGYQLTGRRAFLEPWESGTANQAQARRALDRYAMGSGVEQLRRDLAAVDRDIADWRTQFAEPAIRAVSAGGRVSPDDAQLDAGKERFDTLRRSMTSLEDNLLAARGAARTNLADAADTVLIIFIGFGTVLLLTVLAATATLRAVAVRPLHSLVRQVRRVAHGEFDQSVSVDAAREIVDLGDDVDSMRRRILQEVAALTQARARLEQQAAELQRSNAELEQFAYVASHDLQEPLRKVASFCQLLQQRYADKLDDRADQYIEYAVDGAKRMQELINDLLAFSRVGRNARPMTAVDCNAVVRQAQANLGGRIEETGAVVEVGKLPTVRGDAGLLTLVFQNLIGNAIKFRGDATPHVQIEAQADAESWEFTCSDNGIGIEPEYSERIFVIFQRLHPRASFEGTGIGLAMCRKIIEYHGGTIWLSPNGDEPGSVFRFTIPLESQPQESA